MSSPRPAKAVLNRRIKISKSGRPYMDIADLVAMLERIEKPEIDNSDTSANQGNRNGDRVVEEEPKTNSQQR